MRKLGGLLLIGVLALTACSAPAEELAPGALADDGPSPTQSATPDITAAPIAPQAVAEETAASLSGEFGDPATDAAFLEVMKEKWAGVLPTDAELIGAAKFACDALADGKDYDHTGAVDASTGDEYAQFNSTVLSAYASVHYCTEYNTSG